MELICISDTHGDHEKLIVPEGDILIHAGDITENGTRREVMSFLQWFSLQPHPHKIFIAGNHDFYLEKLSVESLKKIIPENVFYLNESQIEIEGILFWGSPIIPGNDLWAFSETMETKLREHWEKIPPAVDILITHSPPYGILDQTNDKKLLGCKILREIVAKIAPKYHIFGHLHDNYGVVKNGGTIFINATSFQSINKLVNNPIEINTN